MSASSFRHVLAVLDDCQGSTWCVLDRAVELAEAENARLTLAQASAPGGAACLRPLGGVMLCIIPVTDAELQAAASHRLARAAEFVPPSIPLTTVVLGRDTARSLRKVVEAGCHDLIVAREQLLTHKRRLRRAIRKLGISTLAVPEEPVAQERLLSRSAFRPRRPAEA